METQRRARSKCSRCAVRYAVFGTDLCYVDLVWTAQRAAKGHDAIRALAPHLVPGTDRFSAAVRVYVESDHEHHTRPRYGCAYCMSGGQTEPHE